MYENYGEYASKVREAEQKSDDERRLRDAEYRSGTPMPAEQVTPAYGVGMGWAAGQGGHDLGASAMHFNPGMGVSAMPQELDLDDSGEGPIHGHVQGHNQRGDEGHYRRGGQGSGGWSQQ
ncbi:hypothetical protein LA080_002664 [Diaporthe eres]|nr:hypothetical protein LA080_002664 [Diaporthe eres]